MTTPNITATAEVVDGKVTNITVTSSGGGYRRPQRIQRKRTKGWRMPEGAVYVGRPSRWGNPWGDAESFRRWITGNDGIAIRPTNFIRMASEKLRGKDLACWCPLTEPCHADVLLEVANS